jgi:hypothetical protein
MGLLPQAKRKQAAGLSGEIIRLLDQINQRVLVDSGKMLEPAEALPTLRELTERIGQPFNRLINETRNSLPAGGKDKVKVDDFEKASACMLMRVTGYVEAVAREGVKVPKNLPRLETLLKLAEETQRLNELAGDPEPDLKIEKGEGSESYLYDIGGNFGWNTPGGLIEKDIREILSNPRRDRENPNLTLEKLASKVVELRTELVKSTVGGRFDVDTALRSILVTEAMKPIYLESRVNKEREHRVVTQSQVDKLLERSEHVKDRVLEADEGERRRI